MDHQHHPEALPRRRRLLAAAAGLCLGGGGCAALSSLGAPPSPIDVSPSPALDAAIARSETLPLNPSRRQLSLALPDGGCQVTYAHMSEVDISPTWQASFPGSGSRMTWSLVEALTGIRTNDDYNSHDRGYERVVAVKTHYPVKDARRQFKTLDEKFGRAIVILRNPIQAIPSYFNLQYEHLNHLPNHSTRGPNEDWLKYRDHPGYGVAVQTASYENFVSYWMDRFEHDRSNLLLVSYEDLTDNTAGPVVAARIASFLGQVEGVNPIAEESVPCVWETIVNYKNVAPPATNVEALASDRRNVRRAAEGGAEGSGKSARRNARGATREAQRQEVRTVRPNARRLAEQPKKGRTHANPSSLRSGPKVRPYSEEMLGGMVDMFRRLVEKYGRDEDLLRIMTSYIETVNNTPVEEGYSQ